LRRDKLALAEIAFREFVGKFADIEVGANADTADIAKMRNSDFEEKESRPKFEESELL